MRLDKYLKVTGLIKRRSVANELCDAQRVMVNSRWVKASYDVKIGDLIEFSKGEKTIKAKVLQIKDHVLKNDAPLMYELL